MTKRDKQLDRLRRARNSVQPDEIRALLESFEFTLQSRHGSHMVFAHARLRRLLTIPHKRPLLPVYVKMGKGDR